MAKYRKKPVVVEATQITFDLVWGWLTGKIPYPKGIRLGSANYNEARKEISSFVGTVITIHGQETKFAIGDWVIEEPDRIHHYPCKPDIFEQTYEPVD